MPSKRRLKALLSLGYFPKELPPVFTTTDFGQYSSDILEDWRKSKVFKTERCYLKPSGRPRHNLSGSYTYKLPDAEVEIISKPKRGYERRNLHITHPLPQALLSFEIAENWKSIQSWLSRQKYSLDEIRISETYPRSIKGINFPIHRAKKSFIEATSDWLVKTDITRFYPTIYTHSITWAAYGKEKVKGNIQLFKGTLADRMDVLVRNCNRNQTMGIPIGPETSRIIAEIISARIDSDFEHTGAKLPKDQVDRLQDDWFIGVETLESAEQILSHVSKIYREYGLEINGSKTSIDRILAQSGNSWISELASFLSHRTGALKGGRLREFLLLSLRLQSANANDPVVNYAMTVIEGMRFGDDDIEELESFLLKAAVLSPVSLDKICRVIINIDRDTGKIARDRVVARFTSLAERALEKGNSYEAMWLVYTIRGLRKNLNSKRIAELIEVRPGSSLPLILLDMKSNGLFSRSLPTGHWEGLINKDRIKSDWLWLLAYEGIRKGWLADRKGVLGDPFFKFMHERNVVFYDPKRNVSTSRKAIGDRKEVLNSNFLETLLFMKTVRGFEARDAFLEY